MKKRIKDGADNFILKYKWFKRKLGNEGEETVGMIKTFLVLLKSYLPNEREPTNQEIIDAIEQFKDVNRMAFMLSLVVLPGSVVVIPFIKYLADKVNVEIMPSSFREDDNESTKSTEEINSETTELEEKK